MVTAIAPTSSPVVTVPVNHSEKSEKFLGTDFKRWQQKMLFYCATLNLARFLRENTPILKRMKPTDKWLLRSMLWNMLICFAETTS
ncbi:hypothetical protein ACSBR2_013052 [Camellia fascicularis]